MLARFAAASFAALLCVMGCADTTSQNSESTSQPVMSANRLGYNRLGYNRLGYNRLGYNKLSASSLTAAALTANGWADVLAGDDDAQVLFKYIYECAAPPGVTLTLADPGAGSGSPGSGGLSFTGQIGVAPQWLDGQCDADCEQWISACVIARINGLGVTVPISLRGANPALALDDVERSQFHFEELAAFGNIFDYDPATGYPRVLGVCQLPGLAGQLHATGIEQSHWLERRICGEAGRCGPLQVYGECKNPMAMAATQGMPQQITCEDKSDGVVDHCHPEIATVPGPASLANGGLAGYFTTPSYRAINVALQDEVCGDTFCDPQESFCAARFAPACAVDCPSSCDSFATCGDGICDVEMMRKVYDVPAQAISQMPKDWVEAHARYEPYRETADTCPQDCGGGSGGATAGSQMVAP